VGDNEAIPAELKKIRQKFDALASDFERLKRLSEEEFKVSTFKEGTVNSAANNALLILKYVCKTSNIPVKSKPDSNGQPSKPEPTLNDYIYYATIKNKLITGKAKSALQNIQTVRNEGIHPEDENPLNESYQDLSQSAVEHVKESISYLNDWFFGTYLKNAYPEFSIKALKNTGPEKEYKKQESAINIEKPIAAPDQKVTPPQPQNESRPRSKAFLVLSAVLILLAIGVYSVGGNLWSGEDSEKSDTTTNADSSVQVSTMNTPSKDLKRDAFQLLSNYYEALLDSNGNINYGDYFAENISEWKRLEDTGSYKGIDMEDLATKYAKDIYKINSGFRPNFNNLEQANDEGKWIYTDKLTEFNLSEEANSKRKLVIEIIVNDQNKISSLKEMIVESAGGS
jgi:hypothetical protein